MVEKPMLVRQSVLTFARSSTNKTATHGGEVLRRPLLLVGGGAMAPAAPQPNPRRTHRPPGVTRHAGRWSPGTPRSESRRVPDNPTADHSTYIARSL